MSDPSTPTPLTLTIGDATTDVRIGGTELVVPCGVGTLTASHIHSDPPLPEELTNAIGEMIDHLEDLKRELSALDDMWTPTSVVVAGVVARTIAAIEVGGRVDGATFVLTREAAEDVFRTVATEHTDDRRHNPGLPAEIVPIIVAGCCAMVGLFRGLQLDTVTVAMESGRA